MAARGGAWRIAAGAVLAVLVLGGLAALAAAALWPRPPAAPRDLPLAPLPPGPIRIAAFGTSLTAAQTWPASLAAGLGDCTGRKVTIVEVARNGAGIGWAEDHTDRVVATGADVVLVEFAINDADLLDGVPIAVSRAKHGRVLDALAAGLPRARIVLMTMNPVTGPLRRLQRPRLGAHYAMVRDLAAERGLALADLAPRWRAAIAADPGLAPPDGLHPTGAAAERVVVPVLTARIGGAMGAPGCAAAAESADLSPPPSAADGP